MTRSWQMMFHAAFILHKVDWHRVKSIVEIYVFTCEDGWTKITRVVHWRQQLLFA